MRRHDEDQHPQLIIDRSTFPNADDEYTPAQRRVIDRGLKQSLKEYRQSKVSGLFATAEEFIADLNKESAKLGTKKKAKPVNRELLAALGAVQKSAKRVGLDKLTEKDIDAEVTAARRERNKKNINLTQ